MTTSLEDAGGSSVVLDRPLIENPSVYQKKQNKNREKNRDDEQWKLRLYDDEVNTRERVARVVVQVTGSSESDAFRIMMHAHKTGVAIVNDRLCFEVAETYNEGLRKQGLVSDIVPVNGGGGGADDGSSNSEWE